MLCTNAEVDDLLKERIATLKADRDRTREALSRVRGNVKAEAEVTEEAVAKFGELMRRRLREGDTCQWALNFPRMWASNFP